jgi:lipopolysaccharide biosynthesis protein
MNRILCYAHYDPDGQVRRYVRHVLAWFKSLGYDIHFVSTAGLDGGTLRSLSTYCRSVSLRENAGYDFCSWRKAILEIDPRRADQVVLLNSSVIGPLGPCEELLDTMQRGHSDVWSLTESWETRRHLQSYFLCFERPVLSDPSFLEYWTAVMAAEDRQAVIQKYELELASYFESHGFRAGAFISRNNLRQAHFFSRHWRFHKRGNPTLLYPDLLLKMGMPFLKLQLLRENPKKADLARLAVLAESKHRDFRQDLLSDLELPAFGRVSAGV